VCFKVVCEMHRFCCRYAFKDFLGVQIKSEKREVTCR